MDCKMIARRALERKASSVILVHNHPSGSALPGSADVSQTAILKKALSTCDISLTDHVVISDKGYYSFADEQLTDMTGSDLKRVLSERMKPKGL